MSEVSDADKIKLENARVKYEDCKAVGCADEQAFFNEYHNVAVSLLIDLSGKLDPPPPIEVEHGYVKPGGWGAKQDPATWSVTNMKDPADQFKVVDDNGINVATNFKTKVGAEVYIKDAKGSGQCPAGSHFDPASAKCVPDSPPPSGGGDKDQFGIAKIHKDKPGGTTNTVFKLEEKRRNYASGKASEDSVEYTATAKSKEQNSDVEATFYTKINSFKTKEPDSISDKLTGPNHSDGNCCWVIPDFMTDGSASKTLETEKPHPKNHSVNPKPLTSIGGSIVGKWFGHKAISYIKAGERYVESWIHFPVKNIDAVGLEQEDGWRQYIPTTKVGKEYLAANGVLTTCRLDGVKKGDPPDFKYCSVREISAP
jgi:hypothetical protein